jgi:hypothetical protein
MSEAVVSRTLIVLPGATWRAELEGELIRLGVDPDRAPISAGRVLSRICRHAGFLNCFAYDDEQAPEPEEATEDSKPKRSRAVSRRRMAQVTR